MAMNTVAPLLPTRTVPPALIVLPVGTLILAPPGKDIFAVPLPTVTVPTAVIVVPPGTATVIAASEPVTAPCGAIVTVALPFAGMLTPPSEPTTVPTGAVTVTVGALAVVSPVPVLPTVTVPPPGSVAEPSGFLTGACPVGVLIVLSPTVVPEDAGGVAGEEPPEFPPLELPPVYVQWA
jgi:hypothetical protein